MNILSPPIISIYSNFLLVAFALQLSLPNNKDVFVRSEFTKITATVPQNKNFTAIYLDLFEQLVQWDNVTYPNACYAGSGKWLPLGTFKTMKFTIEPVEAGEDISILTDPADLIVSADVYDLDSVRLSGIDMNGLYEDVWLHFVYNIEAIVNANANDEVGIWIKFPADKLKAITVENHRGPTNGMTTNIVEVKEGFSNLTNIIARIGAYFRATLSARNSFVQFFESTGIFDRVSYGDNKSPSGLFYARSNATLVIKGDDIGSIQCGDWGLMGGSPFSTEGGFSKCIVDGYIAHTNYSSVAPNSSLITKDCSNFEVEDMGMCTEENNVTNAITDLIMNEKLDIHTSASKTTNSTFSFCSPPPPPSSSLSSSFPLKIGFWGNSFLTLTVVLFIS